MQDSLKVHAMDLTANENTSNSSAYPEEPTIESQNNYQSTQSDSAMNSQTYDPVRSLYQQRPGVSPTPTRQTSYSGASKKNSSLFPVLALLVIVGGVATGYGMSQLRAKDGTTLMGSDGEVVQQVASGTVNEGDIFGSQDASSFKDTAEGYLQIGGIDGEGSHKLLRDGGPSQTVYLTSTSTDLDKFDGMQVKVWGETFKGQKAGWLMDVGRVMIVKTQGTLPAGAETTTNDGGGL